MQSAQSYNTEKIQKEVKEYYGETLKESADLLTNACCLTKEALPEKHKEALKLIHPQIKNKFYGCGSPLPQAIEGLTVMDLGCGTGRDVYMASYLVGPKGHVIGIDMTKQQLEVARAHQEYHRAAFNHQTSNVRFYQGTIEELKVHGIEDDSVDVVISNCVINLVADKQAALSEIYRVLKPGGELYFSDVYSDRRIPENLRNDKTLWGECLTGALYIEDFRRIMDAVGFRDYRVTSNSRITVNNEKIQAQVGSIKFYSITVRAFKLPSLQDRCQDFGQTCEYLGTIQGSPQSFRLDSGHIFKKAEKARICGNTADMLSLTRFNPHFKVDARGPHHGLFDCSIGGCTLSSECGTSGSCC